MSGRAWRNTALVVLLVVVVNLPLVHSTYLDHRLDDDGVEVTATVTGADAADGHYGLTFRFDGAEDPRQRDWPAEVDRATYDTATATRRVAVRVVPGTPAAYHVDGQTDSDLALVATLVVDAVLVLVALLFWRVRRHLPTRSVRPRAWRGLALEDVTRARPGGSVELQDDGTWIVTGEVTAITPAGIELDCGAQQVIVDLEGHRNDVGHQQPAQVRVRLTESRP